MYQLCILQINNVSVPHFYSTTNTTSSINQSKNLFFYDFWYIYFLFSITKLLTTRNKLNEDKKIFMRIS